MVGHTGDIEATVVACKAADTAVKVTLTLKLLILSISSTENFLWTEVSNRIL